MQHVERALMFYHKFALFSTKTRKDFSIGYWIMAENKLCDQQTLMIFTRSVHHHDNLHK